MEFVWKFAEDGCRALLERLGRRDLYKRVFEIKVADLGERGDYSAIKTELYPDKRPRIARDLEGRFIDAINRTMAERGPIDSISESEAKRRLVTVSNQDVPRIVIDFPVRGVSEDLVFPSEIGDPARKYLSGAGGANPQSKVFHVVRTLQVQRATVRVFAAPELHELIIRYLSPRSVADCISDVINSLKLKR